MSNAPIGFGAGGPLPAPSPWTSFGDHIFYGNGGVVIGTPDGGNLGPGSINVMGLYVNGILFSVSGFLPLTGGQINGPLIVNGEFSVVGSFVMNGPVNGVVLDMGTY